MKILWDYLVYWSITGFIFMQGRMCQQSMYLRNMSRLGRLGKLNHFMQDFFRRWHAETEHDRAQGVIDISQIALIREANRRLLEEMTGGQFSRRFAANIAQLETLCGEIVAQSGLSSELPFRNRYVRGIRTNAFASVFSPATRADAHSLQPQPSIP